MLDGPDQDMDQARGSLLTGDPAVPHPPSFGPSGAPFPCSYPFPLSQPMKSAPFRARFFGSADHTVAAGISFCSTISRRRSAMGVSLNFHTGCFCVPRFTTAPRSSSAVMVELLWVEAVDSLTV